MYGEFKVHHPLGGAGYIFKNGIIDYLSKQTKSNIRISCGAQPNSSPHLGTLVVLATSFALAEKFRESGKHAECLLEIIDSAPAETFNIGGIRYQKSLKIISSEKNSDYLEILEFFSNRTNITSKYRVQSEFMNAVSVENSLKLIMNNSESVAKLLDPEHSRLRIRSPCPECGLSDKDSVNTSFSNSKISMLCPHHGQYTLDTLQDRSKLECNTPLRNLIRSLAYREENMLNELSTVRVTGADYAGFYQENLLYRVVSKLGVQIHELPLILYTPLIVDQSGAKLSKTLYVTKNAYDNIDPCVINYSHMKDKMGTKGLDIILDECRLWIEEPYRLFRSYSAEYFSRLLGDNNIIDIPPDKILSD